MLDLELIMIDNKFYVFLLKGYKVILFFDGNRDFVPMVHTLVAEHILAFFNTAEGSPKFLISRRVTVGWLLF